MKEQIFFTKEWRNIRQKSGCLNHSNELIFQVKTPSERKTSAVLNMQTLFENYVTPHSNFPLEMWAEIPSNNKRTNNAAELFHAHFNAQFYTTHPTIFIFLEVLAKLQVTTYVKMRGTNIAAPYKKAERERKKGKFAWKFVITWEICSFE